MLLHNQKNGSLVKVLDIEELINPNSDAINAKSQQGEEEQAPESFAKNDLLFPSGEALPRCWIDADYRYK